MHCKKLSAHDFTIATSDGTCDYYKHLFEFILVASRIANYKLTLRTTLTETNGNTQINGTNSLYPIRYYISWSLMKTSGTLGKCTN